MTKRKTDNIGIEEENERIKEQEEENANLDKGEEDKINSIIEDALVSSGKWKCILKKPITYQDTEYREFNFDFDKLTGDDALNIEEELVAAGKPVFMNESANVKYLMLMAVRACEEPIDSGAFKLLGIADFNRIKNKARLFLLGFAL